MSSFLWLVGYIASSTDNKNENKFITGSKLCISSLISFGTIVVLFRKQEIICIHFQLKIYMFFGDRNIRSWMNTLFSAKSF